MDPQKGLRLFLRRFGFGVDCHIGPTGALRVPLNKFTKEQKVCLRQLHEQLQHESKEFEIMKIDVNDQKFGSNQQPTSDLKDQSAENPTRLPSHEAQPSGGEPLRVDLGPTRDQAPLRDDTTERVSTQPPGRTTSLGDFGGGRIRGGDGSRGGQMGVSSTTWSQQGLYSVANHLGEEQPEYRDHHSTDQGSPDTSFDFRREVLTELPPISGISTDTDRASGTSTNSEDAAHSDQQEPKVSRQACGSRGGQDLSGSLQAYQDIEEGNQCLRVDREVPSVREDLEVRKETRGPGDHAQEGHQDGDRFPDRIHRGEVSRVSGVPRVPEMEVAERSSKEEVDPPERWGKWRELGERNRKAMEASLQQAEHYMIELMNLLSVDEPVCAVAKDVERIRSNTKHYASLCYKMIRGTPKTVAEVFNPKRFAPHCKRAGPIASAAFDLELGDQLLDPGERDRVKSYVLSGTSTRTDGHISAVHLVHDHAEHESGEQELPEQITRSPNSVVFCM